MQLQLKTITKIIMATILTVTVQIVPASQIKKLSTVNTQINNIKTSLKQDTQKRIQLEAKLKTTEETASSLSKNIKTLTTKTAKQQQQLRIMQNKYNKDKTSLATMQQNLSKELTTTYIASRQPYMKLLLSQQDPKQTSRMNSYYHYLYKYQATLLQDLDKALIKLNNDKMSLAKQQSKLTANLNSQKKQQASLQSIKQKRQSLVKQLNTTIINKNSRLASLLKSKKQLEQTLVKIEKNNSFQEKSNIIKFNDKKGRLSWPTQGKIIVNFGTKVDQSELTWSGILIQATQGKPVTAVANGKVVFAKWLSGYGLLVIINHGNGYMTLYGRNESLYVEEGQNVLAGDKIASVGYTGGFNKPALYFAIRHNATPLNPRKWCHLTPDNKRQG